MKKIVFNFGAIFTVAPSAENAADIANGFTNVHVSFQYHDKETKEEYYMDAYQRCEKKGHYQLLDFLKSYNNR